MATVQEPRIDQRLRQDVLDGLRWDAEVQPAEIDAAVDGGVVTLSGSVDSLHKKWMAEQVARRIYGVLDVVNDIDVSLPVRHHLTDQELAHSAVKAVTWEMPIPEGQVKVEAADGCLILEGQVDRHDDRLAVERVVRRVVGTKDVLNLIRVF